MFAKARERWTRLVLVGFMGAGKSTIGLLLATQIDFPFLDSDHAIEQYTSKTISELFEERGEAQFRILESEIIADLLTKERVVIAFGGGALESATTRQLLHEAERTCVIHLDAPLTTLLERCREATPTRPLLQDEQSLIRRHASRLEHYRTAHLTVVTSGKTPQAVVAEVLHQLSACPDSSGGTGEPDPGGLTT